MRRRREKEQIGSKEEWRNMEVEVPNEEEGWRREGIEKERWRGKWKGR